MIARPIVACACDACKEMCKRAACTPTPDDAIALVAAGYKDRLSWSLAWDPVRQMWWPVVMPLYKEGACVFLTKDSLCELHDRGLKPSEGRAALHNTPDDGLRAAIANTWATDKGIAVMKTFVPPPEVLEALQTIKTEKERLRAERL